MEMYMFFNFFGLTTAISTFFQKIALFKIYFILIYSTCLVDEYFNYWLITVNPINCFSPYSDHINNFTYAYPYL